MAAAWYAVGQAPRTASQLAAIGPGRLATSARNRLKTALQSAPIDEKIALGLSYGRLYSQVSRSIHFTPSSKDALDVEAISRGSATCGLVALRVVTAVQILLDDVPGDSDRRIGGAPRPRRFGRRLGVPLTMGQAEIERLVLAYGDLAEVSTSRRDSYGYRWSRSCLDGNPMPDVQEDWFPAQTVRVLFLARPWGPGPQAARRRRSAGHRWQISAWGPGRPSPRVAVVALGGGTPELRPR